ncbi:MAG: hypothetical protein ACK4R2_11805 [Roseateles sp.]
MSEHPSKDSQPTVGAPTSVDVSAQQLASARRRRFIKMGAGAVPVAMTLASRPVMATNCITASAWGSVQGLVGTSQYNRAISKKVVISGAYTLSAWSNSSNICAGWNTLGCNTTNKRTNYRLSTLLNGSGVTSTAGLSDGTLKVWTILTSPNTYTTYQRTMIAAWLNWRISTTSQACLASTTDSTVNRLIDLGSIPPAGTRLWGKMWQQADAVTYLTSNYLA